VGSAIEDENKSIWLSWGCERVRLGFFDQTTAHWLKQYLIRRHDNENCLWINLRAINGSQRLSIVSMQRIVRSYCQIFDKHVTCHTLRHSYATKVYEKTNDIRLTQDLLGHKNIMTTQIYTHIKDSRKKDAYNTVFED